MQNEQIKIRREPYFFVFISYSIIYLSGQILIGEILRGGF